MSIRHATQDALDAGAWASRFQVPPQHPQLPGFAAHLRINAWSGKVFVTYLRSACEENDPTPSVIPDVVIITGI